MPLPLKLPSGQYKPPGIPRVDLKHPLAQGLMVYCFDIGGKFLELAASMPGVRGAGASAEPAFVTTYGFVENCNVNETLDFGITAQIQTVTASGNWTCASAFYGVTPVQGVPFGRTANNFGSNPFLNWGFANVDATHMESVWNNGGVDGTFSWAGFSVNTFTSMALVATGGTSALTYAQGALQNTATGQTIQSVNTNDHVLVGGGSNASLTAAWDGGVYYGGFWSRPLSAAEILKLHLDPYCFLIFPEDEIFYFGRGNRLFTQVMLPTVKASPSLAEQPFRHSTTLSVTASGVPSLVKSAHKPEMVSANALASIAKTVQAMRTSTAQAAPLVTHTVNIIRTATVNALATLATVKFKAFVTLSGIANALATIKPQYDHDMQGSSSVAPSLAHPLITKIITGTAQGLASMGRRLVKLAVASPALISVSSFVRAIATSLGGSSGSVGALSKQPLRIFSAAVSTVAVMTRETLKIASGSSQQAGSFVRAISRALSPGSAQAIATLFKTKILPLRSLAAASAIISRVIGIVRSAQAAAASVLMRVSLHALTSTVLASSTVQRFLSRSLTALSGTAAALQKFLAHPLSSSSMAAAALIKVARKPFAATVGTMAMPGRRFLVAQSGTAATAGSMTRMLRKAIAAAAGGLGAVVLSLVYDVKRRISIGNETLSVSTVTNEFFGVGSSLGVPATQLPYNQPPPSTAPSVQMPGRSIFIGQGNDPIPAGSTPTWAFQLLDENRNPIGVTALFSLKLTIIDPVSLNVVNSVQDQNILNADRGTVDNQGNVTIVLQSGDTALLNSTDQMEERSLIAIWTYNGGVRSGKHQADFQIQALSGS